LETQPRDVRFVPKADIRPEKLSDDSRRRFAGARSRYIDLRSDGDRATDLLSTQAGRDQK
jgi:hypothetical protein